MKFPIQPIKKDVHGVNRFVENRIVTMLLETHPEIDMNGIAIKDFTREEQEQFAQLIGYSLGGFSELSYVSNEVIEAANKMAHDGTGELEARNEALRESLETVKNGVRVAASELFNIHPDDME